MRQVLGGRSTSRLVDGLGLAVAFVALATGGACRDAEPGAREGPAAVVVDDLDRRIEFPRLPSRVVSLIPATTEIMYALGAEDLLVGRSVYDDYPPEVRAIPDVGQAIGVATERVIALRPDLVLLIAGSDNARTIAEFERLGVPSLVFRLNRLEELRSTIDRLGVLFDRPSHADSLWGALEDELTAVRVRTSTGPRPSVYYDIAYPPPITIGRGSYLDTLIFIAGGRNAFRDVAAPSPTVSLEAIVDRDPDIILYPLGSGWTGPGSPVDRPLWNRLRAVAEGRVQEVDADLLHRLGPRIGAGVRSLAEAIHPEASDARR